MKTFKQLIETLMNPREKEADMLLRGKDRKQARDAAYKRRNDLEKVQARLAALDQRGRYVPGKERDWAADLSKNRVQNILNRADANLSWSQREGNAPGDASHYDDVNRVQRVARAAKKASDEDMSSVSSSNYAGLTKGLSQNLPPEHPLTGINHRYYRTMAREIEKTPNDPMGAQFKARMAAPRKGKEEWVGYSAGGDSVEEDGLAQDQDSALRGIARGRQWSEDALNQIRAKKPKTSSRRSSKKK